MKKSRYIFVVMLLNTMISCSSTSTFTESKPPQQVTKVDPEVPETIEEPEEMPKPEPEPEPEPEPIINGEIKFSNVPDLVSSSSVSVFEIESNIPFESLFYRVDMGKFEKYDSRKKNDPSTSQVITISAFRGTHILEAYVIYPGETKSESILHEWKIEKNVNFETRNAALFDPNYGLNKGAYILTPSEYGKVGLLFSKTKYPTAAKFSAYFSFVMDEGGFVNDMSAEGINCSVKGHEVVIANEPEGADGIAFALTPLEASDIKPGSGGALGVIGTSGLGIKFDTWLNPGEPDGNHISLVSDVNGTQISHKTIPYSSGLVPFLNDGLVHHVQVVFADKILTVYLDDKTVIEDFDTSFVTKGWDDVHLFFSGSTGCAKNRHVIESLSVIVE